MMTSFRCPDRGLYTLPLNLNVIREFYQSYVHFKRRIRIEEIRFTCIIAWPKKRKENPLMELISAVALSQRINDQVCGNDGLFFVHNKFIIVETLIHGWQRNN